MVAMPETGYISVSEMTRACTHMIMLMSVENAQLIPMVRSMDHPCDFGL